MFGVERYRKPLDVLVSERNIKAKFSSNLVAVDAANKKTTFENLESKEKFTMDYALLGVYAQR